MFPVIILHAHTFISEKYPRNKLSYLKKKTSVAYNSITLLPIYYFIIKKNDTQEIKKLTTISNT